MENRTESAIRKWLCRILRARGGLVTPMEVMTESGVPDLYVAWPGGKTAWVEIKIAMSTLPRLTSAQCAWLESRAAAGVPTYVYLVEGNLHALYRGIDATRIRTGRAAENVWGARIPLRGSSCDVLASRLGARPA